KATLMLISSKGSMNGRGGPVSTEADQSGAFAFKDLEPGSYNLMVERQGFVRQMYGARGGNVFSGTPLTVKAGQELTDIQFDMTPQSVIAGKVTDEDGEPVAQVQVAATRTAYIRGKKQTIPVGIGMTNDAGEYRIANLGA